MLQLSSHIFQKKIKLIVILKALHTTQTVDLISKFKGPG